MSNFDFIFFIHLFVVIQKFIKITLIISVISFIIAIFISIVFTRLEMMSYKKNNIIVRTWVFIFRSTPLVAQLFLFCFGISQFLVFLKKIDNFWLGSFVLGFNASAYMIEIFKSAFLAIDKGQYEAALSLGLDNKKIFKYVLFPQALKISKPALMNQAADIIKGSSLLFTVGVTELTGAAQAEGMTNYKFFETFLAIMIVYSFIFFIFEFIQKRCFIDKL